MPLGLRSREKGVLSAEALYSPISSIHSDEVTASARTEAHAGSIWRERGDGAWRGVNPFLPAREGDAFFLTLLWACDITCATIGVLYPIPIFGEGVEHCTYFWPNYLRLTGTVNHCKRRTTQQLCLVSVIARCKPSSLGHDIHR